MRLFPRKVSDIFIFVAGRRGNTGVPEKRKEVQWKRADKAEKAIDLKARKVEKIK